MIDLILALVIVAIVAFAARYIYKEKKKGVKCIGCPDSGSCSTAQSGGCCCCGESRQP